MTRDRQSKALRLEKQRIRQQRLRQERKAARLPSNDDLARALLEVSMSRMLHKKQQNKLDRMLGLVAARLLEVGFPEQATEQTWLELEEACSRGKSLLRQRASAAEIEAIMSAVGSE